MKVTAVTQHALERYMKRTGSQNIKQALNKMMHNAEVGTPIGGNRYYSRGVVYVVVDGEIKTAYKPHTKEVQDAIHHALNKTS